MSGIPQLPGLPENDDMRTICDACSASISEDQVKTGEPGSEYEGCTLCPDCFPAEGQAS